MSFRPTNFNAGRYEVATHDYQTGATKFRGAFDDKREAWEFVKVLAADLPDSVAVMVSDDGTTVFDAMSDRVLRVMEDRRHGIST